MFYMFDCVSRRGEGELGVLALIDFGWLGMGCVRTYMLLVVVDQACVLEVRVEFDLVDGGGSGGRFEEPVEVLGEVVRDADGASEAGGFELFHLLPLGLVLFFLLAEEGGVDQVPGW